MKYILALLLLVSLIGGVAADALSEAQYTRSQFIYLNSAMDENFQIYAQKYWDNYIVQQPNDTAVTTTRDPNKTMTIWFNDFPLSFETPVKINASSFGSGGSGSQNVNQAVWNSLMLERQTTSGFGIDHSWVYTPSTISTSFKLMGTSTNSTTGQSQGMIISQNIGTLFFI